MTFEETVNLLDSWAGREVGAAVRTTGGSGTPQVAVLRGRLGRGQHDPGEAGGDSFFPIALGADLDGPGLRLSPRGFRVALAEPDGLYVVLDEAMVQLEPA